MNATEVHYIAVEDAAQQLSVNRSSMYYYLKRLEIERKRFPLDRRSYISDTDLERIRAAKQAALERKH